MNKPDALSAIEREALWALKGVGPKKVLTHLEEMGLASFKQLAKVDAGHVLSGGAALSSSNCWKNSPNARAATHAAIELARQGDSK